MTPINPNGIVSNTKNTREKLCSCMMSNVNTTTKNNGTPFATEAPPLLDFSIAPPVSMVMPSDKLAFISVNFASDPC